MNFKYLSIGLIVAKSIIFGCSVQAQNTKQETYDHFLNDKVWNKTITKRATAMFNNGNFVEMDKIREGLVNSTCNIDLHNETTHSAFDLNREQDGVLVLASFFLCKKCPNYHILTASAFVVNKEGVCATNHHVFKKSPDNPIEYISIFAIDHKGNVFPVTEVLAGNEKNDLALFKIDADKPLTPVSLGLNASVGEDIHLLSHPDGRNYSYSRGCITRSYIKRKGGGARQSISADFARGSSGAPIFNRNGEVIGVVTATNSIYYKKQKSLQMVVKEIIPIELLNDMCHPQI